MKIAICDDDEVSRERIAQIVSSYAFNRDISVSVYDQGYQLLEDSRKNGGFDIYILDIIMPGLNGIQLGLQLRQAHFTGKIIYLTSSQEYAVASYKTHASGYLLKPVQKAELISLLDSLVLSIQTTKSRSLIVRTRESIIRLNFSSILYAELVRKTVVYHLISGKCVESTSIRSTFSEAIQELLRDRSFSLCGSTRVVNLSFISEMDGKTLTFGNGERLYVGRRSCRELRSVWYNYWVNEEVYP